MNKLIDFARRHTGFLILFLVFLATRILCGTLFYSTIDIIPYNLNWVLQMKDGFWNAYSHIQNLDYPPLFPSLLYLLVRPLSFAYTHSYNPLLMLLLKLIPILFDFFTLILFYAIALQTSKKVALFTAAIWVGNLSLLFNCSFWGQTDVMMLFFILLTLLTLHQQRPVFAWIFFALGCLTKLQFCYLAPILLLELLFFYPVKTWGKSLLAGLATGLLGWLPFMIGSKNLLLPFSIYFGGFGSYPYVNLHAANLYGLFPSLHFHNASSPILGSLSFSSYSYCITLLILLCLFAFYVWMKRSGCRVMVFLPTMLYMNAIFLFTTQMHERYQLPVVLLSLLCWLYIQTTPHLIFYFLITAITLLNQMLVLFSYLYDWSLDNLSIMLSVLSFVNLLAFLFSFLLCRYSIRKQCKRNSYI